MKIFFRLLVLVSMIILISCSESGNEDYIEESGNIEAINILLSSQANGKVESVLFEEGNEVNKGDTIMVIDHPILKIKLKQALAGKSAAEAKLSLAKTGARREDIQLAEEKLNQTKENLKLTEENFSRMKNLYAEQAITKKQYDEIQSTYNIAKSQYNSAQNNLDKVKNITRSEELKQLEANYQSASANVEMIKQQITDSYVVSPINGFIVEQIVELGESVNYGTSLLKISNLNNVEVKVYVNEKNLGKVKLGQKAEISTDTYEDKIYEGKVAYISPEAEFTPKNIQTKDERTKLVFAVKIKIENQNYELKSGMPADVKIKVKD